MPSNSSGSRLPTSLPVCCDNNNNKAIVDSRLRPPSPEEDHATTVGNMHQKLVKIVIAASICKAMNASFVMPCFM